MIDNKQEGLEERIYRLESQMDEINEDREQLKSGLKWIIFVAVIVSVIRIF